MTYAYAADAVAEVAATTEALFDCLDDQASLGAHMEKPSAMTLGGRMIYQLDAAQGRAAGAVIRMRGNILWLKLFVEEVVVERTRPLRKTWETRGRPVLLIIGSYRMGFEIEAAGPRQRLRVFINYNHPASIVGGMLAKLFAAAYARWCVTRMTDEARRHFS